MLPLHRASLRLSVAWCSAAAKGAPGRAGGTSRPGSTGGHGGESEGERFLRLVQKSIEDGEPWFQSAGKIRSLQRGSHFGATFRSQPLDAWPEPVVLLLLPQVGHLHRGAVRKSALPQLGRNWTAAACVAAATCVAAAAHLQSRLRHTRARQHLRAQGRQRQRQTNQASQHTCLPPRHQLPAACMWDLQQSSRTEVCFTGPKIT